jgi:hypothetical protein
MSCISSSQASDAAAGGSVCYYFAELQHWKSIIIRFGAQAAMKSQSCIIWVLAAFTVIALTDAIPDPPAVNPYTVSVASRICEARGPACERLLNSDLSGTSHLQIRWIAFTWAYEPNLPSDWIVLTGYAADPSPPNIQS